MAGVPPDLAEPSLSLPPLSSLEPSSLVLTELGCHTGDIAILRIWIGTYA